MWYSLLRGAAQRQQQTGHNSTWLWESRVPSSPLSLVHQHQSEKQMRKRKRVKKKKKKERRREGTSTDGVKLTSSFVWRVSPFANVTWTHGMESAAWWGMGHLYFTTLDLYFTCTLSDKHRDTEAVQCKGGEERKQSSNPSDKMATAVTVSHQKINLGSVYVSSI